MEKLGPCNPFPAQRCRERLAASSLPPRELRHPLTWAPLPRAGFALLPALRWLLQDDPAGSLSPSPPVLKAGIFMSKQLLKRRLKAQKKKPWLCQEAQAPLPRMFIAIPGLTLTPASVSQGEACLMPT